MQKNILFLHVDLQMTINAVTYCHICLNKNTRKEIIMVIADKNKCIKCGACINDCVVKLLTRDSEDYPYMPQGLEKFCLNCQHCLAVCPEGAISCSGITAYQCAPIGDTPSPDEMLNLIRQRRTVRRYVNENISPEIMEKLKNSLAWSATGCNDHSLIFKVIENKDDMDFYRRSVADMLKKLFKWGILKWLYPNIKRFLIEIINGEDVIFRNAPHMIICAVRDKAPCKDADPFIALSNFDLMAQSCKIGTCWCGFAVYAFKFNRKMRDKLNLPKGYKIASVMLFGKSAVAYKRATAPENFKFL